MKTRRFLALMMILVVAFLVAACGGSKEPIVEKPASEINLSLEDLGEGWTLTQDADGLEGLKSVGVDARSVNIQDGNMRFFAGANPTIQIVSAVLVYKSEKSAEKDMKQANLGKNVSSSIQAQIPDMTIETIQLDTVGENQEALYGVYEAVGLHFYTLVFRENNVGFMVMLMGPEDIANQETLLTHARTLANRATVE